MTYTFLLICEPCFDQKVTLASRNLSSIYYNDFRDDFLSSKISVDFFTAIELPSEILDFIIYFL